MDGGLSDAHAGEHSPLTLQSDHYSTWTPGQEVFLRGLGIRNLAVQVKRDWLWTRAQLCYWNRAMGTHLLTSLGKATAGRTLLPTVGGHAA